jgi:hypothetical protein
MAKRKRGKIVEKWQIRVNSINVEVPVRMVTPEYADQDTMFIVDFEYGEHEFLKSGNDINVLRREVKAWLIDVVTFEYEAYFYVVFGGSVETPDAANKAGEVETEMTWRKYLSGTTSSGKTIYRDCTGMMNNGDWINGDLETGLEKRAFLHQKEQMVALIPATPENEAGLKALAGAFEVLHEKMMKFLSPEQIEHNFTKMIGNMPKLLE